MDGEIPSPPEFLPREKPRLNGFKEAILEHLAALRGPRPNPEEHRVCSRTCHLAERNYVLELVKGFVKRLR